MRAPSVTSNIRSKEECMKISRLVALALALATFTIVSGCATAPEKGGHGDKPAYTKPKYKTSETPEPAVTPGGMWPPVPETETAPSLPQVQALTTDGFDLEAPRDPKAELKHRAIERWALLIAQHGTDAYSYLSPGYQQAHDRVKYGTEMASRPVRWYRATFDHADCSSEDACEVTMLVDFKVKMSAGMGITESFSYIRERWISVDGVWYHLPTDVGG